MSDGQLVEVLQWQRLRNYADERFNCVVGRTTELPTARGPIIVLQLLPYDAFAARPRRPSVAFPLDSSLRKHVIPYGVSGGDSGYLHSGLWVGNTDSDQKFKNYTLIRPDGIFESAGLISRQNAGTGNIGLCYVAENILKRTMAFLEVYRQLQVNHPIAVHVSSGSVNGYTFDSSGYQMETFPSTKDTIIAPLVLIEGDDTFSNPDSALQPIMDFLWMLGGQANCFMYKNGKWEA